MEHYIYKHTTPFICVSGAEIQGLTIHYSTLGTLNSNHDNVIWICHALTANSDVSAWWSGLIGHGKLYDPNKHFIICANILGSCYGTSGPIEINPKTARPYYLDFPFITIRDMVGVHEILKDALNITKIHTCIGGSLGGQQAMEWAILNPILIENLVLLATNAFHSPWGIAFNEAQRMAIQADPSWKNLTPDAGREGLKAARAIALLSYRNYHTYECSQKEDDDIKVDNFKASSYQNYQGEKLVNRFNCHAYWYLTKAMDSHHVGRGRGSAEGAL
ncbi:MAG TPA: homoserine O-acetyltransferase, partial [Cytophagaceae bacterium]